MAIVNLIHKRVGNDIRLAVQVLDNGVALDWSSVTHIYASLQSDSQRIRMGMCVVDGPDPQDTTKLRLTYPAKSSQYTGVARLVLECNYMGSTATLDTPAFVFVGHTAEEGTGPVDVEIPASVDPETNNLQILVADVDTSVLDDAIQAAYDAADAANEAAQTAEASVSHFTGGTTGQVLSKMSDADYDFKWDDPGTVGSIAWGHITGTLNDQTDLKSALDSKQATISDLSDIRSGAEAGATAVQPGDLATVATSGSYSDLLNKPSIPSAPGTLNTDNSSAQSVNSSEALSGTVKLHKVSKTGSYNDLNNKPSLATVATSGSYNDLSNKPSIPAAQVNSDWNAGSGVAQILNKPTIPAAPGTLNTNNSGAQTVSSSEALSGAVKLHKISKTGSYADLNNKPTIPSISLNGSTTTSPSFYAPTGAGTLGQVLTSNGSGAPTWQDAPSGAEGEIVYLENLPGYASDLSPSAMRIFLQGAIDYVAQNRAELVFPKGGIFTIDIPEAHTTSYDCEGGDGLQIPSDITIDFNFSTINIEANHWYCYNILHILPTSQNITMKNGYIVGDRDDHVMSYTISAGTRGTTDEWNYCMLVEGPGKVVLENMDFSKVRGDGIYFTGQHLYNHTLPISGDMVLDNYDVDTSGALQAGSNVISTVFLTINDYYTITANQAGIPTYLVPRSTTDRQNANIEESRFLKISYYDGGETFISQETVMMGDAMTVPTGAVKFRITQQVGNVADTHIFWVMNVLWNALSQIVRCSIHDCGRNGLVIMVCQKLVVEQCRMANIFGTNNQVGIDLEGVSYIQGDIVVRDCVVDNPGYNGMAIPAGKHVLVENCDFYGCGIYSYGDDIHISNCKATSIEQGYNYDTIYDTDLVYPKSTITGCECETLRADYAVVSGCKVTGSASGTIAHRGNEKVAPVFLDCELADTEQGIRTFIRCTFMSDNNDAWSFSACDLRLLECKLTVPRLITTGTATVRLENCELVGTNSGNTLFSFASDYCVGNKITTISANAGAKFNFIPVGEICHFERNTYGGAFFNTAITLKAATTTSHVAASCVVVRDNVLKSSATSSGCTFFNIPAFLKDARLYFINNGSYGGVTNWTDFSLTGIQAGDALAIYEDGTYSKTNLIQLSDARIKRLMWQ